MDYVQSRICADHMARNATAAAGTGAGNATVACPAVHSELCALPDVKMETANFLQVSPTALPSCSCPPHAPTADTEVAARARWMLATRARRAHAPLDPTLVGRC